MLNFSDLIKDILNEKEKTFKDLENEKIIEARTFYHFKEYTPFLPTILKIANYLEVSLDYIAGRKNQNSFKKYKADNINFYKNLCEVLQQQKISKSKLAKDLHFGRSNFTYWKNGSLPKFLLLIDLANYLNCDIDDFLDRE